MASRSSGDIYAETLHVFEGEGFEPLTTPEVAAALDANRRTVYKRLETLVDRGELETKETGANARVWWRPPDDTTPATRPGDEEGERTFEGRFRAFTEPISDVVMVVDENAVIQSASPSTERLFGYSPAEMEGNDALEYVHPDDRERVWETFVDLIEHPDATTAREEYRIKHADDSWVWIETVGNNETGSTLSGYVVSCRDIAERKEHERELEETTRQLQAVVDTVDALIIIKDADGRYQLMNDAARQTFGIDPEEDIVGLTDEDLFPPDIAEQYRSDDERVLERGETIEIEDELPTPGETRTGLTLKSPMYDENGDPAGVCAVSADITERKERERELRRQREQLAALDELNSVVQGITERVIEQSTRAEIEEVVCDRLAESDSYQFAWICAIESGTGLEPRVEAGVEGYLEEIPLSTDSDDPTGLGPTGRAVRTQEIEAARNALDADDFEPWHEYAREYGYRSSAAIPIVHGGSLYGVIGIYSERPDAFAKAEREVVGQLGEVVGHAIAAVDRKRALQENEIVELEFRIRDVEAIELSDVGDGSIVFDQTVSIGDGSYLEYGIARGDTMGVVQRLVESEVTPHSGTVNVIETVGDETRFEVELAEPPVLSTVTEYDGYVDEARIEDGEYHLRIHATPGANVGDIIDLVVDAYPATEMISRRQTTRSETTLQQIASVLADRLTERQQAALEAGYFAGFFEWPRSSSGEDVADSLGIAASTFHQHVRKAERKLLEATFEDA